MASKLSVELVPMFLPVRDPATYELCPAEIEIWTQRDYEILHTLCWQLGMVEVGQLSAIFHCSNKAIRRRMRELARFGLVDRFIVNAHYLLSPDGPLYCWEPDGRVPDAEVIARSSQSRWCRPSVPIEVFVAGRRAANQFGVPYRGLPALGERNSLLLHSQVFVDQCKRVGGQRLSWVRDDLVCESNARAPRAYLVAEHGMPIHCIEAGTYTPAHIRTTHQRCREWGISYELW